MRKVSAVVPPAPQTPARLGFLQTERSPNPTPSAGRRTGPTPLMRSKARAHPTRTTVLLRPNTEPKRPSPKLGFQASASRGPQFVESGSYGYLRAVVLIGTN